MENKNAAKKITAIGFEEFPMLRFDLYEGSRYTHQTLMKANTKWDPISAAPNNEKTLSIKEVTVYYNEGPSERFQIGEIKINWKDDTAAEVGQSILDGMSSGSSSDGSGAATVALNQSAVLEKIDYSYSDELKDWFKLELDGKPIDTLTMPLKLSKGKRLAFTYKWSIPDGEEAASQVFKGNILLTFRTEEGQQIEETLPINYNLYLSDSQLKQLVRSGGGEH